MITRADILAHLEAGIRVGFLKGQRTYQPLRSPFVRETKSDGAFEQYGDMGALPWPAEVSGQSGYGGEDERTGGQVVGGIHEGGAITVLGGNERAMVVYNRGFDIPIGIYHDAINDNRVGSLDNWARSAGARFEQHMDYLCFDALNQGAAATYGKCYDGQSLFSASHADPGAEYSTAQSNLNTSALSLDNFDTVYIAACKYMDDRGKPSGFAPDLLIHAVDLKRTAAQITDNPEDYATGNRARNPYEGDVKRLSAPGGWLDTTAWFLVVTSLPQKPINLQIRQRPQLYYWDDHTQGGGIRYYKWYSRYEVFPGDWRLVTQGNS
jgi:phage major head subunit gpT-like protein